MKKMITAIGLLLAILFAFWGSGSALAVGNPQAKANNREPVQNPTILQKGLKSPHSARKEAAKRLKIEHQQQHEQKIQNWAKKHHGYTSKNQAANTPVSSAKPAIRRGAK